MAISFNKLKSPLLAPTDLIPLGKYKGCRVCDVIEDGYEYLIWAEKQGFLKYSAETVEIIKEAGHFMKEKRHYEEEEAPYEDGYGEVQKDLLDTFAEDDIPF